MHHISLIASAFVVSLLTPIEQAQAVEVCHIANAGTLIKGENVSLLIDGLLREDQYDGRFALPSPDMQKAMFERTGLFDKLGFVLSTHRHADHYDPLAVREHLDRTNDVRYILPADAIAALEAHKPSAEQLQRVIMVPDNTQTHWQFGELSITAYDVDHGPNMPQNTGYLIEIEGKRFFHTGDMNASREQLSEVGLNSLEVDGLLIPFWYGLDNEGQQQTLKESWHAGKILPMHFSAKPAPWMEQFGGPDGVKKKVVASFHSAEFHDEEGKCTSFK